MIENIRNINIENYRVKGFLIRHRIGNVNKR